jgi:hypothetical protein
MTEIESDPFVEIVAPSPFDQADALFESWLAEAGLTRNAIASDDVRVDTIRSPDGGSRRRYLVRADIIPSRS